MGKAAKARALRRGQEPDRHRPDVTGPRAPGTLDRATRRATIPRAADFWHERPGRRVACDLHVAPDGICGHCGGQTPIKGIGRDEYDAIRREELTTTPAGAR